VKILFLQKPCNVQNRRTVRKVDSKMKMRAKREVYAWSQVTGGEHCVQLVEVCKESIAYFLVMEQCRCSVLDELEQISHIRETDIARVFREMLLGIAYVHRKGLVHRDIKPANFLLGGPDGKTVKLCDFGLTVPLPYSGRLIGVCGTSPYIAPEMLIALGYLESVDVWSMGVTAYLILFGDFPYAPSKEGGRFEDAVLSGVPEPSFKRNGNSHVPSQKATEFVRALLSRTTIDRCTADEALQLPFLNELNADARPEQTSASLRAAIGKARQRTLELDGRVDPTKQRQIDEILELLRSSRSRGECRAQGNLVRHFSFADLAGPLGTLASQEQANPRLSKSSTHCGSLSSNGFDFWDNLDDLPSTSTEASSPMQGEIDDVNSLDDQLSETSWMGLPADIDMGLPHAIST
jgi:serine/threonine protein kinase